MIRSNDPIVDASGRLLAPPQLEELARPAGPWDQNRAALRGRDVRAALAGERPRAEREAETIARMNAARPGASWHFVTHPTVGRILVSVPENDPPSDEIAAELANGRRV